LPNLLLPHGNSDKVRFFLSSLATSFEDAIRAEGTTEPAAVAGRVAEEIKLLEDRGLSMKQLSALERLVFFDGYPKTAAGDPFARTDVRKFLTECAKCHTIRPGGPGTPPQVRAPTAPERWVLRGRFTHVPHQHMDCVDCHRAAQTSKLTSDILMPKQALCAECHRPPADQKGSPKDASVKHRALYKMDNAAKVAAQRESGGVKWDCQSCHMFHAPADAGTLLEPIPTASSPSPATAVYGTP
jgi:predicted CXXCH cytochrome family protein